MQTSGEFGRGGNRRVHARLRLHGRFNDSYVGFLKEKADRLSLPLNLHQTLTSVTAETTGPEAMIGAFEMSAIIGIQGCSVEGWSWIDWDPVQNGE